MPTPANRPDGCAFHPRCPRAVDDCRDQIPPLQRYSTDRAVACHVATAAMTTQEVAP